VVIGMRGKTGVFGLVVVAFLLAACAEKAAPASGGAGSTQASQKLGTRAISGIGTVLMTPGGFTLYYLKTETNGNITCTGDCASAWPPLLASSGKVPAASPEVAPHLGTIERPDGTVQVTFHDKPLYTYASDSAPGETKGQGVGGVWFAATTSAGSPSSSDSGYPGY
jgi:predicted lipoprotein with Yx(FWY)xxD motif